MQDWILHSLTPSCFHLGIWGVHGTQARILEFFIKIVQLLLFTLQKWCPITKHLGATCPIPTWVMSTPTAPHPVLHIWAHLSLSPQLQHVHRHPCPILSSPCCGSPGIMHCAMLCCPLGWGQEEEARGRIGIPEPPAAAIAGMMGKMTSEWEPGGGKVTAHRLIASCRPPVRQAGITVVARC